MRLAGLLRVCRVNPVPDCGDGPENEVEWIWNLSRIPAELRADSGIRAYGIGPILRAAEADSFPVLFRIGDQIAIHRRTTSATFNGAVAQLLVQS